MSRRVQWTVALPPGLSCGALNDESEFLVCGTNHQKLVLCNPWKKLVVGTLKGGHSDRVTTCSFDRSNRHVISAGDNDAATLVWDVASERVVRRLARKHASRGVISAGFWNDSVAFSGCADGTSNLWDLRQTEVAFRFPDAAGAVTSMLPFETPAPAMLASSMDGFLRHTDVRYGLQKEEFCNHGVVSLAVSPDPAHACLAISCTNGKVYLKERRDDWKTTLQGDLEPLSVAPLNVFHGHQAWRDLHQIAFDSSGLRLFVPTEAPTIRSWELIADSPQTKFVDLALFAPARGCQFVRDNIATLRRQSRSDVESDALIVWSTDGTVSVIS